MLQTLGTEKHHGSAAQVGLYVCCCLSQGADLLFSPVLPFPFLLPSPFLTSQCVAYIAAAEIPTNQLPELITTLLLNVTTAQNTEALKVSSLEAIGYICEEIVSQVSIVSSASKVKPGL